MFDIGANKPTFIPSKPGKYSCGVCWRDFNVPAKGSRCPYCKARLTMHGADRWKTARKPKVTGGGSRSPH